MTFLLAVLAAAAEPAPPTVDLADEADLLFRRGIAAYRDRRIEDALADLLASNRLVPNRNVMFNIARCYEQLGALPSAWRWYAASAAAEPDPTARDEAETALDRLTPQVALVDVTTDPPGATVYVERRDLGSRGTTPLTLALPAGEHDLLISLSGHADAEVTASLRTGERTTATATLSSITPRTPEGWTFTEIRAGSRLLLRAEPGSCAVLPGEGVKADPISTVAPPSGRPPSRPVKPEPGRPSITLRVASAGQIGESVLVFDPDRAAASVAGASDLHRWALDRCAVRDAASLAAALDRLPSPDRTTAAALFAHWAAVQGHEADSAARGCVAGTCDTLASLLVR